MPRVNDRPGAWLESTDAFVFSSRLEGWGIALLEAMASGLPCAFLDRERRPGETIADGVNGIPAQSGDPKALAEELSRAMGDGGLRHPHFILSYGKLQTDATRETANALRFLGCEVDTVALDAVVQASQFGAMRELELAEGMPDHNYDRDDEEGLPMRRGKAGSYSEYLMPANVELIERMLSSGFSPEAKVLIHETGFEPAGRQPRALGIMP